MGLVLVTPPAGKVVSTADAKLHQRIDSVDPIEDAMIDAMVAAAVDQAEQFLRRPLLTGAYQYTFDRFPGTPYAMFREFYVGGASAACDDSFIRLPIGGVLAVSEIGYIDTDGVDQIVDSSAYRTDITEPTTRIAPAYLQTWPRARAEIGACYALFTAGYGANASDVPASIVAAVKLIFGNIYANRESVVTGITAAPLPMGAEHILWPHRVWPLRGAE